MNANQLRTLAIVTMLIDHVGAVFFEELVILRVIGRLAFPIFAFLIANGYFHTRSLSKYIMRMGIFALVSEIPFDLAFFGKIGLEHQNVFFTLFLALLALWVYDKIKEKDFRASYSVAVIAVIGVGVVANLLATDYGLFGVLMVFFFHEHRNKPVTGAVAVCIVNLFMGLSALIYIAMTPGVTFQFMYIVQSFGVIGALLTLTYNKLKGRGIQLLNYAFYPVHLGIIAWMNTVIK